MIFLLYNQSITCFAEKLKKKNQQWKGKKTEQWKKKNYLEVAKSSAHQHWPELFNRQIVKKTSYLFT